MGILGTGSTRCSLGMEDNTDTISLLILGYFVPHGDTHMGHPKVPQHERRAGDGGFHWQ